jgi:ABC-type sulfate transport system permease subunit
MGTINYLVNPEKKAIFVLGKMYPGWDLCTHTTKEALTDACIRWGLLEGHNMVMATKLAENTATLIAHTIGLDNNIGMSDNDDMLIELPYRDYVIVGSFYANDSDVGKTYGEICNI